MFDTKKVVETERFGQLINGMLLFVELFVRHVILIIIPECQVADIHSVPPAFVYGPSLHAPAHTCTYLECQRNSRGLAGVRAASILGLRLQKQSLRRHDDMLLDPVHAVFIGS